MRRSRSGWEMKDMTLRHWWAPDYTPGVYHLQSNHIERGRFDGGVTRTAALALAEAAALRGLVQAGELTGQATTGFS